MATRAAVWLAGRLLQVEGQSCLYMVSPPPIYIFSLSVGPGWDPGT